MKRAVGLAVLMAAFMAVQAASAQPTQGMSVKRHDIEIAQTVDGLAVWESLEIQVTDVGFDGNVTIRVPIAADAFEGMLTNETGGKHPIPAERLATQSTHASMEPFLRIFMWDLGYTSPGPARFTIEITYTVPAAVTFTKSLFDGSETLLVFARPADGFEPLGVGLGELIPVGDGRVHAIVAPAGQGKQITMAFVPAGTLSEVTNLTKYVWGAAGLAVGALIMYAGIRQGWFKVRRPPKFEKGGQMESRSTLEARRRTLMAALRELETGHDAKEIPDDAYAPLKEEYKAQAVRVLRNLDAKKEKNG